MSLKKIKNRKKKHKNIETIYAGKKKSRNAIALRCSFVLQPTDESMGTTNYQKN